MQANIELYYYYYYYAVIILNNKVLLELHGHRFKV